ncbi:DNA-binding protein [Pseudonocardia sp. TMWB2A]|uniref:excisionase family DNA-binding protein n=1 Tax=Pseudonocardia sp. TMWB2A TaxID=687430 RepID=UPI00307E758D
MTLPASAQKLGGRLPSEQERAIADQLRRIVASNKKLKLVDGDKNTMEVVLTPMLSEMLLDLLRHFSKGNAVTLVPVTQKLSTQQAADLLNVSRPYLIGLLEKGELAFELVGRHRRIRADDLFAYKEKRNGKRREALESLAKLDGETL